MRPDLSALRERVREIEARKPLNRAEALAVLIAQAPAPIRCGCGCGEPLDPLGEGVRDEHVIALGLTGTNALPNREWWRLPCSKAKDKRDATSIAKAKRLAGETCAGPTKHPIRGRTDIPARPFNSGLTKGFDGKVKPRKQRRARP